MTKDFKTLFMTQFLGAFNDNIFKNALVILITFNSIKLFGLKAELLVPLAGGLFMAPFLIFSGTAGQIADRFNKKHLIQIIKFIEIIVMALAAYAFYLNSYLLLFVALFLMGTQSAFFGPLKYGIIPSLVEAEGRVAGNAYVSAGTFVAILLGTILGGLLAMTTSFVTLAIISVAILGWIASKSFELGKENFIERPDVIVDYTLIKSTWTIFKETTKDKATFLMIIQVSWFWFVGAAVLSLLPLMVKTSLEETSTIATFYLALFTVGMGAGSIITKKISQGKAQHGFVSISALGVSVMLVLCYGGLIFKNLFLCSFAILAISSFGGCFMVTLITALQEVTDESKLSRIVAGNNIWNALFMVLAALVVMALTSFYSIETTVLILGLFCFFCSILFYSWNMEEPLRQWFRLLANLFYKVEVHYEGEYPEKGPVIVVANHVSFVDWIIITGVMKRPVRYILDWSYYYLPLLPFWFRQAKIIPIATKKESPEVLEKAFSLIGDSLNEGATIGIFAEGRLCRDGQMRSLQPGVNKILKAHPSPVVLLALDGLWGSFFSHSGKGVFKKRLSLKRRTVRVTISAPILPQDYDRNEAKEWFIKSVSHYHE
jgi:1-acyl-sn-glycerol-3-phosphate acyltransferase